MNIFKIMAFFAIFCFVINATDKEQSNIPGGMDLLKKDQALIDELQAKLEESGGNAAIKALKDLAEQMKELNNKRHQMHEASRNYAKAFDIFSKNIEEIIALVNQVLTAQADDAIKSAKVVEIMTGGQDGQQSKKIKRED